MPGLQEKLKFLTPIKAGAKIAAVLTASRLNAIQECIKEMAMGRNVTAGGGIFKKEIAGGFSLYGRNGLTGTANRHRTAPLQGFPDGLNCHSRHPAGRDRLLANAGRAVGFEDHDHRTRREEFTASDPEEVVWLQINVDPAGTVTSATIEHGVPGDPLIWESFPDPIEFDDPLSASRVQQVYYHLLAYMRPLTDASAAYTGWPIIGFDSGDRQLVSTTRNNLIVCPKCSSATGELVYTVAPWFTPYYGT
jgi:hypothetical protein